MASLGVDVFDSRELQATLLAFRILPKEVTSLTRKYTKQLVDAEWQKGLNARAATPLQRAVLARTATSSVTNSQVSMKSATKGFVGRSRGEKTPASELAGGAEFGANIGLYTKYQRRSKNGGTHQVSRRTMRHFGYFRKGGRVVFKTGEDLAPRIASMYVQTLLRTTAEAFEN